MKTNLLLALALLAFVAAPASAEIKRHPTAKVEIDIPTGWNMQTPDKDVMFVTDPAQDVFAFFIVTDAKDVQKALQTLDEKLKGTLTDVKWAFSEPKKDKLNGMDAMYNKGEGKVKGKPVNLGLVLVHTPADKVLSVVAGVDSTKKEAHKAEIDKLIGSI